METNTSRKLKQQLHISMFCFNRSQNKLFSITSSSSSEHVWQSNDV